MRQSIDELRKVGRDGLAMAWHQQWSALDAVRTGRQERLDEAEAIADKAKAEERGLLASEQRRFDQLLRECDELHGLIGRFDAETQRRAIVPAHFELRGGDSRRCSTGDDDGDGIVLRHGQSVAEYVRRKRPGGEFYRSGALGRILRAKITGRHDLLNEQELRAMGEGSGGGGGTFLLNDQLGGFFIDKVRDQLVLSRAGMLTVPMDTSELSLIRVVSDGTPAWKAENAAATESAMEFGRVNLTAKTVIVLAKLSRELFDDAAPGSEALIERSLVASVAQEVQRAALYGSGTEAAPRGLRYNPGITRTVLGSGDGTQIANYDFLLDAMAGVYTANHKPTARIYASRTMTDLASLKEGTTNAPLAPPPLVASLPEYITNVIPITNVVGSSVDCSDAFVGDFGQLMMGLRTNFNLQLSETAADTTNSAFTSLQVWIRVFMRVDFATMRDDAFQIVSGVRPPA